MKPDLFDSEVRHLKINDIEIEVLVSIFVSEDDLSPNGDFDFGDETENRKYLARFESGELFMGLIHVQATAMGLKGHSYLGACHLRSNNFFDPGPFTQDVESTVREHDMISEALGDLERTIIETGNRFSRFSKVGAQ